MDYAGTVSHARLRVMWAEGGDTHRERECVLRRDADRVDLLDEPLRDTGQRKGRIAEGGGMRTAAPLYSPTWQAPMLERRGTTPSSSHSTLHSWSPWHVDPVIGVVS